MMNNGIIIHTKSIKLFLFYLKHLKIANYLHMWITFFIKKVNYIDLQEIHKSLFL